jgi:PAS domain S-box-containing protein
VLRGRIFGGAAKGNAGRFAGRSRAPAQMTGIERTRAEAEATELKQREASFRLLFDSNPVPMIVCAIDGEHVLAVNDAAVAHYGYNRAEFEKLTIRTLQAFDSEAPLADSLSCDEQAARTWKHVKADGTLIDLAIYSRNLA